MPLSGYLLDANLLVLLVAGNVGTDLIDKHRRLQSYTLEDYELLIDLLGQVKRVKVTPNVLTETSNLLGQHGEPERSILFDMLRSVIEDSVEVIVSSRVASLNSHFVRLGLSDAALLEIVTADTPLLTVDLELYLAALSINTQEITAINFAHLRNL